MSYLSTWLKSKNISAHSTVIVILAIAGYITNSQTAQTWLLNNLSTHIVFATGIISLAGIIFRYSKSSTAQSTVQQAQQLLGLITTPTVPAPVLLLDPTEKVETGSVAKAVVPLFLLFTVTMFLCGCPASTGMTQTQLQKAATASQQAMIVVQGFAQGETLAYNQGKTCLAVATTPAATSACVVISDADHLFIQQSVVTIATLDQTTNTCIGAAATSTAAATCANTAIATITQLQADGTLKIKSPTAQQDFSLALIGAKTALVTITTLLGGS